MESSGSFTDEKEETSPQEFVLEVARSPLESSVLGETQVRHDHSIKQQLYFMSTGDGKDQKTMAVCFSQALENPQTNRIEAREFLQFSVGNGILITTKNVCERNYGNCCPYIDEVSKLLYFVNIKGHCFNIIITYDLAFNSQEDMLGYRAVTAKGNPRTIHIQPSSTISKLSDILIDQTSGKLFIIYSSTADPHCHMPAVIEFAKGGLSAKLVPGKAKFTDKSRDKNLLAKFVRSRQGHLLVLFWAEMKRHEFLCSYTDELEAVNCVKIDRHQLVMNWGIPKEQLDDRDQLVLVGQVRKYVLFLYWGVWLAAKWPKDWYTQKKLPSLIHCDWVNFDFPNSSCTSGSAELVGMDNYCLFNDQRQTVTRIKLGQRLKDYRFCSNCNMQETHKRRNKNRKRISQFKVCRLCKAKNLLTYYCSMECVKAQWKEHKITHQRSTINL